MEHASTPPTMPRNPKRPAPWGIFVGLILILAIIVAGAYYAFSKRFVPKAHSTPSAMAL
jgi:hypothetical protein